MPPLRAKQGPRGWSVELGMDGMLEGCDGPPASSQASSLRACMRQLLIVQGILQSTTVQQGLANMPGEHSTGDQGTRAVCASMCQRCCGRCRSPDQQFQGHCHFNLLYVGS